MTYNAASRKDIRAAEKAQQFAETIDREVITGIMSVPNGRAWIHKCLADNYVFADPFSPDAGIHAYHAGQRSSGIKLFNSIILYAPTHFITMIEEAHVRDRTTDERTRKSDANGRDTGSGSYTGSDSGYPFDSGDSGDTTDGAEDRSEA